MRSASVVSDSPPHAVPSVPEAGCPLVHAWSPAGNYLITSPNVTHVPTIVEGIVSVQLRQDGRFGHVDPTVAPQIYAARFAYMAAIRKGAPGLPRYGALWSLPRHEDFSALLGCPITRLGFFTAAILQPLHDLTLELSERVHAYVARYPADDIRLLLWHEVLLQQALSRLRLLPASFGDQILQLVCFQRHYLLADAYLEYQSRLRAPPVLPPHEGSLTGYMGAWSSLPSEVDHLCSLGLPVWLVRSHTELLNLSTIGERVLCLPSSPGAESPPLGSVPLYEGLVGEKHLTAVVQARAQYLDISHVPSVTRHQSIHPSPAISQRDAYRIRAENRLASGSRPYQNTPADLPSKKRGRRGASHPCMFALCSLALQPLNAGPRSIKKGTQTTPSHPRP